MILIFTPTWNCNAQAWGSMDAQSAAVILRAQGLIVEQCDAVGCVGYEADTDDEHDACNGLA